MKLEYRQLRAPKNDGQVLQDPPLRDFENIGAQNQARIGAFKFSINGIDIQTLRGQAQTALIRAANDYSNQYRNPAAGPIQGPIVMSGHQPQLFHPGVWYKNFALSKMSERVGSVGINFIVDNDLGDSTRIHVPGGSLDHPVLRSIAYDKPKLNQPFEGRSVNDLELWSQFPSQVRETVAPFVKEPLITRLWPIVDELIGSSVDGIWMGPEYAIAAARHRIEGEFGLSTLEIPLSAICQSRFFSCFAAELIDRGSEFLQVHNFALEEYRIVNRIRSLAHPVPALSTEDDWFEVPFWCWKRVNPRRAALWVRSAGDLIELSNRGDLTVRLSRKNLGDELFALNQQGICLRPRALVTTMYARLVLANVFLHGIGGAKYDQLTDVIANKLFGIEPPEFYTLSSTNLLPITNSMGDESELVDAHQELRAIRYHPENFSDALIEEVAGWKQTKSKLIANIPERGDRKMWQRELESVNGKLARTLEHRRQRVFKNIEKLKNARHAHQILGSREFSFCLFPDSIMSQLLEMAH